MLSIGPCAGFMSFSPLKAQTELAWAGAPVLTRNGEWDPRCARTAGHLAGGSDACACAGERGSARCSHKERLRSHVPSPFLSVSARCRRY